MNYSKRRTFQQWESLIQKQEQSDLSQREFCIENNIGYSTFTKWRQKSRGGDKVFLPVTSSKTKIQHEHFSLSFGRGTFSLSITF